jgi:type I restriction enzyme, S subunit
MQLRPGYKETEVGVIPEDWDIEVVGEAITDGPRNGYSGQTGTYHGGTPTLSLSATTQGRLVLDVDTVKYLNEVVRASSPLFLRTGDVLVQRSNTIDLVGTTAVFDGPENMFVYPDLMMRLRFRSAITGRWFWRYANSVGGRRYFQSVAAGSTGSMPKISGSHLREMRFPSPPLREQFVVTTAVDECDALIEFLGLTIAKKRDLKQAAMQQLLTGQTRLPGFEGEWTEVRMGSLGECVRGVTYDPDSDLAPRDSDDTIRLLRANNVQDGIIVDEEIQFVRSSRVSTAQFLRDDDLLICMANGSKALVGKSAPFRSRLEGRYTFGAFMASFRPFASVVEPKLVPYLFMTEHYRKHIAVLLAGSSINNLTPKSVEAHYVLLPEDRAEQRAIAEVLSDMDAEIEALEARVEKTRMLKQGMMQELLTGRVRLV